MEVTGRQESIATPVKPNVDVKVNELSNSDSDQSPTQQKDAFTNGHSNGHPPVFSASSGSVQITRVIENTKSLKGRIVCELDDVDEEYFNHTTFSSYVEYIADERLMHMPRRGSKWDRVLKAAEFFGYQIYNLGSIVAYFVPESHSIALSALASCRLLLEVGPTSTVPRRDQKLT